VREENGANKTTTFTPADLHDDQVGGDTHGSTASGPQYWTVQGKNGLTYEYGKTSDSQIAVPGASGDIREWLLDKVSDVNGNTYTITYGTGASGSVGIGVPTSISWTPASSGSTTYNYEVALQYIARQAGEAITEYANGQQIENDDLLDTITVSYQGTVVRFYQLSYSPSPVSKRSLLASIQECADSTLSHCLGTTSFSYNQGALSVGSTGDTVVSGATSVVGAYDFAGTGRSDVLYNNGGTLYVAFANGSGGFGSAVGTGISAKTPYAVGDLLHDGKDGILADNGGDWSYYTWNGSSFVAQAVTSGGSALPVEANGTFTIADLDGDGLPDLVITHVVTGSDGDVQIYARQNTSSGGQVSFSTGEESLYTVTTNPAYGSLDSAQVWGRSASSYGVHSFHFTGDAREGLIMAVGVSDGNTPLFELVSNGFGAQMTAQEITGAYSGGPVVAMNWNSDSCTDLAWNEMINGTLYPQIYVSPCNGAAGTFYSVTYPVIGAITLNGDAEADLLVDDAGTLGYYPSSGNGVGALVTTGITGLTSAAAAIPISVTGDGLPDLGMMNGGSLTYYQHVQVSSHPDLLSSITDGESNTLQPSYVSITAGAYTLGTGATDPESDWIGDLWVTNTLTLPDGIGGTYTKTYAYSDARWSRLRGLEGFEQVKVTDSRKNTYTETSYDLLFPLTGLPTENDAFQSDGTAISKDSYVISDETLASTQYQEQYYPYAKTVTQDAYEVGGSENGQEITNTITNYTPDEYGNFTAIDTTTTDKDPGSPFIAQQWTTDTTAQFTDDKATWCLALPTSVSVAKTAPGEPTITRTITYTPDDTNCREDSDTADAGNSSFDVTRAVSYDAFGNISQLTVTGAGMAARTWKYRWGNTGQFQQTVQDPVASADGYEESIGYNFDLGLESTDVMQTTGGTQNTPPTKWFYDSFGRVTQEVMPDGTSQNFSYTACGSSCYNSNHFETVTDTTEGSGGADVTDKSTYLDRLGRRLVVRTRLMDGSYAQVETQFDDMGNRAKESSPCGASSCTDYWTQVSYDLLNRPSDISRPDPENPATLDTQQIAYEGRTTTITQPLAGEVTTLVADVTGSVRETLDSYRYGQSFTRDSDGNVRSVTRTSGGNAILGYTFDYGGEGDYVAAAADQVLGNWTYTPDALGEVRSYTDAKGQVFNLYYDGLSRAIERDDGVPTSGSPETVTTWMWGHTPSAHDVNQLDQAQTTSSDGIYTEVDSYDGDGRPSDKGITIPGDTIYHYDYAYDPTTGLLSTLQYPVSTGSYRLTLAQCYQYGILTKVADTTCSGSLYWEGNQENPMGEITEDTLGNGIITQRQFYPVTGWLASVTSGSGPSPNGVQNQSYLYDALGDVTQRQDNDAGLSESFWYDDDNRLWKSTLQNGDTANTNLQISYNPDGSISQKTETGGTDAPSSYSITQWTSYNYPKVISATVATVAGSQTVGATLDYGPDRQRWRMIYTEGSGSETTEYIGSLLEKVTSSTGITQWRYYIRAADGLAAIQSIIGSGSPLTYYVLSDQESSISTLLNSTGSVAVNESFTPFGVRREASAWSGSLTSTQGGLTEEDIMDGITRQGFTGQTVLGLMGLNHMNGRVEDPLTGTFLSPDPYVADPTNSQDYNRYTYAYDNPLSYLDPTGFDTTCEPACPMVTIQAPPWSDAMLQLWDTLSSMSGLNNNTRVPCMTGVDCYSQSTKKQQSQTAKPTHTCTGMARSLGNSGSLTGKQGGIPGQTEQPGTANIIPTQFGLSNGSAVAPYAPFISGTVGNLSFSGVTDVIGGKSPIPGVNVRDALQQLNPGLLIIELNSAPDQKVVPATIMVPAPLKCPEGTTP
jgi:RHS repeat-associated protein